MDTERADRMGLMRITADDWRLWRRLRLAALEEASHAFSQQLSDWTGRGDTEARWRSRLTMVPFNVVAYLHGTEAGIVSGAKPTAPSVQLVSLWVAPWARGCGVADALVGAIIDWSRGNGARGMHLDVFADNTHAIRLYERHGFVDRGPKPDSQSDDSSRVERRMELALDRPRAEK